MGVMLKLLREGIPVGLALVAIAWIMPAISNAPRFFDNPAWYVTVMAMGMLLSMASRWLIKKVRARKIVGSEG